MVMFLWRQQINDDGSLNVFGVLVSDNHQTFERSQTFDTQSADEYCFCSFFPSENLHFDGDQSAQKYLTCNFEFFRCLLDNEVSI